MMADLYLGGFIIKMDNELSRKIMNYDFSKLITKVSSCFRCERHCLKYVIVHTYQTKRKHNLVWCLNYNSVQSCLRNIYISNLHKSIILILNTSWLSKPINNIKKILCVKPPPPTLLFTFTNVSTTVVNLCASTLKFSMICMSSHVLY